ncbi:unnamed protein product [Polarella glacialis]|uniref:Reverse transcriptase domain-containing protein n=1 Tax=Polarella glacialis TaxID=89957 RepID=A0A813F5W8_POLGL|nr:unnamed protein product [Polarella glacialis]
MLSGELCWLDYGQQVVHARLLLDLVEGQDWAVAAPDNDVYVETCSAANPDLAAFHYPGPGGGAPAGVPAAQLYGFEPMTAQHLAGLMARGHIIGTADRLARGVPVVVGAQGLPAAPPAAQPAAPAAGLHPGVPAPAGGGPQYVWVAIEDEPPHVQGDVVVAVGSALPLGHVLLGANKALVPAPGGAVALKMVLVADAARYKLKDLRTLPVQFDAQGVRRREFQSALILMNDAVPAGGGLQLAGPGSALKMLKSIRDRSLTPVTESDWWRAQGVLAAGDRSIFEYETLARILESMIVIDQLNIPALTSGELIVRRMQVIKEAHRISPSAPDYSAADLFMGWPYRRGGRSVDPDLAAFVAGELKAEAAIAKEARKAREEEAARRQQRQHPGGNRMKGLSTLPVSPSLARMPTFRAAVDAPRVKPDVHFDCMNSRQREIFPLPLLLGRHNSGREGVEKESVGCRRRAAKRWRNLEAANEIVGCANEMYCASSTPLLPGSKLNAAQTAAQQAILSEVAQAQISAPDLYSSREAVHELLRSSFDYTGSRLESEAQATVRSYSRGDVSIPVVGTKAPKAADIMDDKGREILQDAQRTMLLTPDEWGAVCESGEVVVPYMDVVLKKDTAAYYQFIKDLYDRGMIRFTDRARSLITPFFVVKKNGKLRLVLDCRAVNRMFKRPPSVAMAAGYSWSQVEIPAGETLYVAQSDIKDYFYSLSLPEELREYFGLPAIPTRFLQEWGIPFEHGGSCDNEGFVCPIMTVVPMGWSWAMWIAQRAHQHQAMLGSQVPFSHIIVDGAPVPDLSDGSPVLLPYADNLNVAGIDRARVQAANDAAVARLREVGLIVHEETDASSMVQSLGFIIDGEVGSVRPAPEKLAKVIAAFRWLTHRPRVTGKMIEKLIGHAARWAAAFLQITYSDLRKKWTAAFNFDPFSDPGSVLPLESGMSLMPDPVNGNHSGGNQNSASSARSRKRSTSSATDGPVPRKSMRTWSGDMSLANQVLPSLQAKEWPGSGLAETRASSARERAGKRTKFLAERQDRPRFPDQSLLEQEAVIPSVGWDYLIRSAIFQELLSSRGLPFTNLEEKDNAFVAFLNNGFEEGWELSEATKHLAAFTDSHPDCGHKTMMPRSRRCLQGWKKLDPGRTRPPLPWCLVALVAMTVLEMGSLQGALMILTLFATYCRPGEGLSLRESNFHETDAARNFYAISLNPSDRLECSKVGLSDETIMLDSSSVPELGRWIANGLSHWAEAPLFKLDYLELKNMWDRALKKIGLPPQCDVLYQLRHAGPSHDRLHKARSALELTPVPSFVYYFRLRYALTPVPSFVYYFRLR